jgi:hypothetical protein
MNALYPFSSGIVIDDDIFELYGGDSLLGTDSQRAAAYFIAERTVSEDISTLLVPTTVTGTYTYPEYMPKLKTDWAYVHSVDVIRFIDVDESVYYTITGTANIYASIRDQGYGIIDIHQLSGNCRCHSSAMPYPYQVQVVYTAGLPLGISERSDILLAITTYAIIILNEIIGFGNEEPGGVGVQQYSNQEYRAIRTKLGKKIYGSSAKAQFISDLLTPYRKLRYVKLGW